MDETIKEEPPIELNHKNIVYWSSHYKKLVVEGGENAIGTKALKFIELNCIEYYKDAVNPKNNCYICKPIEGYNKTTYKMKNIPGGFECDCQYHQTTKRMCSHILGLYMQLKIWNHNKRSMDKILSQ
jgi:hypothetical protein